MNLRLLLVLLLPATITGVPAANDAINFTLQTQDGLHLATKFYPGDKGKESVPVILLHDWKGSREDFSDLAVYLQSLGHAVLVPDLRGHGDSTRLTKADKEDTPDAATMAPSRLPGMQSGDMEALIAYLRLKNNRKDLNLNRLCLVGAGMGAVAALEFARNDARAGKDGFQGQSQVGRFVKALILISPDESFGDLRTTRSALQDPYVTHELSVMVLVGKGSPHAFGEAIKIYAAFRRSHPEPPVERLAQEKDLVLRMLETSRQGTALLAVPELKLEQAIAKFIELRLVRSPKAKTDKFYQWAEMAGPLPTLLAEGGRLTSLAAKDFVKQLQGHPFNRSAALIALKGIGEDAGTVVPGFMRLLEDQDAAMREAAIEALGSIEPTATAAVPGLAKSLQDNNSRVRKASAEALGKMARAAEDAAPALAKLLEDADWQVRDAAVVALSNVGPAPDIAMPAFVKRLGDGEAQVRQHAAEALGKMGPDAKEAVPALTRLFHDKDWHTRDAAILALTNIGPAAKDAIPPLLKLLEDEEGQIRYAAAGALGKMGPAAKEAVPGLRKMLQDKEGLVRYAAAWALGQIGPAAKDAAADLERLLQDQEQPVREAAEKALKQIGG